MATQQVTVNFPYYQISVNGTGGRLNELVMCFQTADGGILGGMTQDDVADALRDIFAAQPGYVSSQISKYESVQTIL